MSIEHEVVLDGVTKRYGTRLILDQISMSIARGETIGLIGPSGGGKSTVLRCINGLTQFEAGTIQIGPHIVRPDSSRGQWGPVRRRFGMVFQDFQLFPHLTALQNVMEAPLCVLRLPRRVARERGMLQLERVGLVDRADYYPRQLSGGQKQRVAIARALAMETQGLLCDEITSALDPELKCEVLETLENLRRDGMTLMIVTHEMQFARRAADRVWLLADGKIIEHGTPEEVFDHPRTERARRFLDRVLA